MTTALFGGSFDPVHLGHLAIARRALEISLADSVVFIPAARSPLKEGETRADDADRLEMLRLATAEEPNFSVSDIEIERGGVSYTVDTLRQWRRLHPEDRLVFIAGMDSLLSLSMWREPLGILALCEFVAFARPGFTLPEAEELGLGEETGRRLLGNVVVGPEVDVSSSAVRAAAATGGSLEGFVPPEVARYIADKGLYRREGTLK